MAWAAKNFFIFSESIFFFFLIFWTTWMYLHRWNWMSGQNNSTVRICMSLFFYEFFTSFLAQFNSWIGISTIYRYIDTKYRLRVRFMIIDSFSENWYIVNPKIKNKELFSRCIFKCGEAKWSIRIGFRLAIARRNLWWHFQLSVLTSRSDSSRNPKKNLMTFLNYFFVRTFLR